MTVSAAKRQLYRARAEFRRVLDEPGVEYRYDGQVYRLSRFDFVTNRNGHPVKLAVWAADCRECGAPFETAVRWGDPPRTRRCLEHRKPVRQLARSEALAEAGNGALAELVPYHGVPTAPDPSAALYERLDLLAGVMMDLGQAIENMTTAANAARHESRQINERLGLLLRQQTETRRALGQTSLHVPARSSRRRPLGAERPR